MSRRTVGGIRSERQAKTLVGSLMSIDQLSNPFVVRVLGRACDAAVVREGEQRHPTPLAAHRAERLEP